MTIHRAQLKELLNVLNDFEMRLNLNTVTSEELGME